MTVVFTGRFGSSMFDKGPKVFEKRSSDQSVLGHVYLTRVQKVSQTYNLFWDSKWLSLIQNHDINKITLLIQQIRTKRYECSYIH